VIKGARQVGKTYLVDQFGKEDYSTYLKINLEYQPELHKIFERDLDPHRIVRELSLTLNIDIRADDALLFFDEIQACPLALTSLKYFYEEAPEYHVIAAGSLLGVHVGKTSSFPVGKVNFLDLHPLTFDEYLNAKGKEFTANKIKENDGSNKIPEAVHNQLTDDLKEYLFVGGMPEVVNDYIHNQNPISVREIQNDILTAYQNDFVKYSNPSQAVKTSEVWRSIPYQLAKENKKFKYSDVKKKARSTMYETTMAWLLGAGLIQKCDQIRAPKLPLKGYQDDSKFKLYFLDTGLLGAQLGLTPDLVVHPSRLFKEYNGAFIENYVANEIYRSVSKELCYWASPGKAEVDFLLNIKNNILPFEVKSGNSRELRSLRSYQDKHTPKLLARISPKNFEQRGEFINIPIYATYALRDIISNTLNSQKPI